MDSLSHYGKQRRLTAVDRDRRALAEPAEVAPEQLRPRFALAGAAAKQLLALRRRASASQPGGADGAPACFVRGEPLVPSQRSVRLEQVVAERVRRARRRGDRESGADLSPPYWTGKRAVAGRRLVDPGSLH